MPDVLVTCAYYNAFWKHLICARCSRLQDKIIWESNLNLKDAHKLVIKSKCWQSQKQTLYGTIYT